MKIETFIKNEVKKYRTQVKRQQHSKRGVNLDRLECFMRQHLNNCKDEIYKSVGFDDYQKYCELLDLAEKSLQAVDNEAFGVYDGDRLIGYNFVS